MNSLPILNRWARVLNSAGKLKFFRVVWLNSLESYSPLEDISKNVEFSIQPVESIWHGYFQRFQVACSARLGLVIGLRGAAGSSRRLVHHGSSL